jgi:endoglucanase
MKTVDILKQLCEKPGLSGYEKSTISPLVANLMGAEIDEIGNVYKQIGNGGNKILIEAHIDEVGFRVTKNYEKLWLKFVPIGGMNPKEQNGAEVVIFGYDYVGKIIGGNEFSQQRIDIYNSEQDITCGPNTPIYFKRRFDLCKNNIVKSPALDNRSSLTVLCMLANALKPKKDITFYLLGSAQHEQGGHAGFKYFGGKVQPDILIGLDSAYAQPYGERDEKEWWSIPEVGKGPAIQTSGKGFVSDNDLIQKLEQIAKEKQISYQWEIPQADAGGVSINSSPRRKIVLNVPVMDQHTRLSTCSLNDIENSFKLLNSFLVKL